VRTPEDIEALEYLAWEMQRRPGMRARRAKARAARALRTPPWADLGAISLFYEEAVRKTVETGVLHEVDHIVPLLGKTVSGLHVPENLRVIPWLENRRKSNRHGDDDVVGRSGIEPLTSTV
jgi:hypothetical protein